MAAIAKIPDKKWAWARGEFESGRMTMRQIAPELGITFQSVSYKSKKEGWKAPDGKFDFKRDMLDASLTEVKPPEGWKAPSYVSVHPDERGKFNPALSMSSQRQHALDTSEEKIMSLIMEGNSYQTIAKEMGVHPVTMMRWFDATEDRAQLVARARQASAYTFVEQAEQGIREAKTILELARARDLAQHLRWKAKAFNPRQFGEKAQLEVTVQKKEASDDEINARILELQKKMQPVIEVEATEVRQIP